MSSEMFIVPTVFVAFIKVTDVRRVLFLPLPWRLGISASYVGVSETIVHFVIYEKVKAHLQSIHGYPSRSPDNPSLFDFLSYLAAAACSKSCASTLCYPHEVARTRLREEGNKYRSFVQTLRTVYYEENIAGLYRGLLTHLIRQIPVGSARRWIGDSTEFLSL